MTWSDTSFVVPLCANISPWEARLDDLSLRCDDPEQVAVFEPETDYRNMDPKLLVDTDKLRMWHKMDRTFR